MKRTLVLALLAIGFDGVANAQFTITDIGLAAPAPQSANDITNIFPSYQLNDGLNYWWNNNPPIGQTFTTGGNAGGYTLTNLAIKTAGAGGGGELGGQTFTLRMFSIDGSGNATLVQTITAAGQLKAEGDWLQWSGLGVSLQPNTLYGYTFSGGAGYEELANNGSDPYAGGEICLIPSGGGTVTYGSTRASDAVFDMGLTPGTVAGGTATITDIGASAPTPGADDIYQLVGDAQNTYSMNYYWDSGCGQTFTTPNNSYPWIMNRLAVKWAGGGGGGDTGAQHPIVRIYSVANGTTATVIYSNSPASTVSLASENGEWWDCTGMSVVLQPNQQYAYTVSRQSSSFGWELMSARDGNPYPGGKICLIPAGGGTINYGSQGSGNNSSDSGFIVGLVSPAVFAQTPTYSPNDYPIYAGTPVTLNEAAAGSGTPFTYQWLTDGGSGGALTNIPGATSSNLLVDTTGMLGTNQYQMIVFTTVGGGQSSTGSAVSLVITNASAPILVNDTSASPNTTTNFVGLNQSLSVTVVGTKPIAYQWYKASDTNGTGATAIAGATNPTLTLTNLQLTDSGSYSVFATNAIPYYSTNSSWLPLTVVPASQMLIHWQTPVPFNGLTAAEILTNTPAYTNIMECAQFGRPSANITVTVDGVPYVFYGGGSKVSVVNGAGQTTGAYLTTGTGDTTGDTNFDQVLDGFNYDFAGGNTNLVKSIVLHNLLVGSNYCVQIFALDDRGPGLSRTVGFQDPNNAADASDIYGESENKYLTGTFTAPSTDLSIQEVMPAGAGNINAVAVGTVGWVMQFPPAFTNQPSSVGTFPGRTVQFAAGATGQTPIDYLWQVNTGSGWVNLSDGVFGDVTISGSTNTTLTVAAVSLADSGWQFMATATNSVGGTDSLTALLTVSPAPSLSGAYSTNVLALRPAAYWPLNETGDPYNGGVSGLGVYDASGNMHDGMYLYNAYNWFDGIVGPQPADGYPQFDAGQGAYQPSYSALGPYSDDYVILPGLNLNTNTVTITMWVYPDGAQSNYTGLLLDRNNGTKAGMSYTVDQKLGYVWNNDAQSTWSYTNGPVIPTNMWSLVAVVVSPNNASFYVINTNGVVSTTYSNVHTNMTWSGTSSPDPLIFLGSDSDTVHRTFNGVIDEVAVFNYDLTGSQLATLAGVTYTPPVNTNAATLDFGFTLNGTPGSQMMNFTWAADHLGWQLYTNSVGLTATNSWFPVPGSAAVTHESLAIDPTKTNVFYQMRYP